jgi:DNA-binding transcriptional LysR family regulator
MPHGAYSTSAPRRPIHWNLHRLRIFATVARHLSFTKAATELAIAQPALSHQVKALEQELGVELFERRGRRIELTEPGRLIAATSGEVLQRLDEAARGLTDLELGARGSVDVAADTTSGIYAVPTALGAFHRAQPAVEITLHVHNRTEVLRQLSEWACDVAVMADPPHAIGLDVFPFLSDLLVVIAPPDHPLAGRQAVPLAEVARERFLVREQGSGTRAATERLFARAGLSVDVAMELGSTGAIKRAVAAGLGVAVVSLWSVDLELDSNLLAVVDAVGFPIERRWSIVSLKARRLSAAARRCRDFLAAHAAEVEAVGHEAGRGR